PDPNGTSADGGRRVDSLLDAVEGHGEDDPHSVALAHPGLIGDVDPLEDDDGVEPAWVEDVGHPISGILLVSQQRRPEGSLGRDVGDVETQLDETGPYRVRHESEPEGEILDFGGEGDEVFKGAVRTLPHVLTAVDDHAFCPCVDE